MDAGEMPKEALVRELMEEVGLETNVGRLLGIFPLVAAGNTGGIVIAYHANPRSEKLHPLEHNDDVDAAGWFAVSQLPEKIAFESSLQLLGVWKDGQLGGNVPSEPGLAKWNG